MNRERLKKLILWSFLLSFVSILCLLTQSAGVEESGYMDKEFAARDEAARISDNAYDLAESGQYSLYELKTALTAAETKQLEANTWELKEQPLRESRFFRQGIFMWGAFILFISGAIGSLVFYLSGKPSNEI